MFKLLKLNVKDFVNSNLEDIRGKHPAIYCKDQLSNNYHMNALFAHAAGHVEPGGLLLLEENITGDEDSWLNALIATVDPTHVRFGRAEEIIAGAWEHFTLMEFVRGATILKYTVNDPENIISQIESFPDYVKDALNIELDKDKLTVNVTRGMFAWQRLR